MVTKIVNEIIADEIILKQLIENERKCRIKEALKIFTELVQEIYSLMESSWIKIKNKDVYYNSDLNIILPNLDNFEPGKTSVSRSYDDKSFINYFSGFNGKLINFDQASYLFYVDNTNPFSKRYTCVSIKDDNIKYYLDYENEPMSTKYERKSNIRKYEFGKVYFDNMDTHKNESFSSIFGATSILSMANNIINNSEKYAYNIPVVNCQSNLTYTKLLLKYDLVPEELSAGDTKIFTNLKEIIEKEYLIINGNGEFKETEKFISLVLNDKIDELNGLSFRKDDILSCLKNNMIELNDNLKETISYRLLNCDKLRADIEPYDIKILEDVNRGHWDLWNQKKQQNKIKINSDYNLVGRNPISDVKKGGVIGIDFGTKSTVVVFQEDTEKILPMRIGMGQFRKKLDDSHFENPTVMEFRNIDDFITRYNEKQGRPNTLWEDITISHTAFNNMISSESSKYYSFIDDLKQWAGNNTKSIRIIDNKKGNEKILPAYLSLKDGDIDPIEIYAYYIGLYINNMFNGIYLEYILSFPVTYEKSITNKIIESFKGGLRKSLPIEVIEDSECMDNFLVYQGASEPAAYAVCALQEYKFEPIGDNEVFYGIFDFGGGTTDFDFGIWREANETEKRFDYVISHFGAGGDQFLGGENLLELLSFEVFKSNQDKLRENGIVFLLPPECERFAGSEILINESQEAKLNVKQLKEKLRPLWEKHEGYEKIYQTGILKANVFDKVGNTKMNFELDVNIDALEQVIENRIEKGIKNFFEALKLTFNLEDTREINNIVIFLAGNSSKSEVVTKLFDKHINEITSKLRKTSDTIDEYFKVFPPLGTSEALEIQKKLNMQVEESDEIRPTGKTGVAYGLLMCRKGSRIKVVHEIKTDDDEIKFKYYLGYKKKNNFRVFMDRETEYNVWNNYIDAGEEIFEIYYTNLPEATTNSLPIISGVKKIREKINVVREDSNIYIRAVSPSEIEFVVALEHEIKNEKYLSEVVRIKLG